MSEFDSIEEELKFMADELVYLKSVEKERNALRAELATLKSQQPSAGVVDERTAFDAWFDQFGVGSALYPESTWQGWQARARLNPCLAQAVQVNHDSDCSMNNRGVPELLGPCDCSASKDK